MTSVGPGDTFGRELVGDLFFLLPCCGLMPGSTIPRGWTLLLYALFALDGDVVFGEAEIGILELLAVLALEFVEFGHTGVTDPSDRCAGWRRVTRDGVVVIDLKWIVCGVAAATPVCRCSRIGRSGPSAHQPS